MPTPFYHLSVAEDILVHANLDSGVRQFLQENRAAFYLGNTAPDVQTVSGQDRTVTHFFDLPIRSDDLPAWERMLGAYPSLADPARLTAPQAAFLAGYFCHLQADWLWVLKILAPVFGPWNTWHTFQYRTYLHNVLRAYLDRQILGTLPPSLDSILAQVAPHSWLPFVEDTHLYQWRDLLSRQLAPGATIQTVEVFAARQGLAPGAYYQLMNSEERLEAELFTRLTRQELDDYRQQLIADNLELIPTYLHSEIWK